MIRFEHNQHQIEAAEQLSQQLGFFKFILVDQGRNTGPVFDNKKQLVYRLGNYSGETDFDTKFADSIRVPATSSNLKTVGPAADRIACQVVPNQSIYVNSIGEVYPCCWLGMNPLTYGLANEWQHYANAQLRPLVQNNNALAAGLEQATQWFDLVEESWARPTFEQGRLLTCNSQCGQSCS
jgi:hypothetical protein